jgi:hypothetical protein
VNTKWAGAWAGAGAASLGLALVSPAGGNVAFVVGALLILSSVFFIGLGGERRYRVVRSMMGVPISKDPIEPEKRQRQISIGVRIFVLGLAIWAPLVVLALR